MNQNPGAPRNEEPSYGQQAVNDFNNLMYNDRGLGSPAGGGGGASNDLQLPGDTKVDNQENKPNRSVPDRILDVYLGDPGYPGFVGDSGPIYPLPAPRSGFPSKNAATLLPGSSNSLVEPKTIAAPANGNTLVWTKVPQSWYDLPMKEPYDIRDLIANANLAGVQGSYLESTTFATPVGAWNPTPFSLTGLPQCLTLGTDNQLLVEQAKQWNFKHLTANLSASLSPLLSNIVYLRAGERWQMSIPLSTTGTVSNVQLSFRNNSASNGNFIGAASGGIPAISFTGTFTGPIPLTLTLKKAGHAHLAFRVIDYTGKYSMFGLECIIVN